MSIKPRQCDSCGIVYIPHTKNQKSRCPQCAQTKCLICGQLFHNPNSLRKYCQSCRIKTCPICGKQFRSLPSKKRVVCSWDCSAIIRRKEPRLLVRPRYPKDTALWQIPEWLRNQYVELIKSAGSIAKEFGCTESNVLYFLNKFNIQRRQRVNPAIYTMTKAERLEYNRRCAAERGKRWRCLNPSLYAATKKRYRSSDKGKTTECQLDHKRRNAKALSDSPLTNQEWEKILDKSRSRCFYCGEKRPLTIDHVIPLSKGGLHTASNIVPACKSCNSSKQDKLWLLV